MQKHETIDSPYDYIYIISDLTGGGAQKVLVQLTTYLANKQKNILVVTLADNQNDVFQLHPRIKRITIYRGRSRFRVCSRSPFAFLVLSSLVAKLTENLIRIYRLRQVFKTYPAKNIISFLGSTNVLTILSSWGLSVPVIISERNDPARQHIGYPWNFLRKHLYKYADKVTANSVGAIRTMEAYVPKNKLYYVPNPVDILSHEDTTPENVILAVGRLNYQKGYDILLHAIAKSHIREEGWKVVILGDGELKAPLLQLTEELHINDIVEWKGFIKDTKAWYQKAGLFVMPSRFEGTPNALLEASAHSLPCIVTDVCAEGIDFLKEKNVCTIIPTEDSGCLAKAMDNLIINKDRRKELGKNARDMVTQYYTPEKVYAIWEDLL